ncbi:hypothetical protein ES705_22364 [subsurface metagenome]
MKDKKKAAAGAGAGLAVLAIALAIGLGAKKAVAAPAPPVPTTPAEKYAQEITPTAKEIQTTAQADIQAGVKTIDQTVDEMEYQRQLLLNEAVIRTTDPQLALIHPGMTMEQVDEIKSAIYAETGADDLLNQVNSIALAEACLKYEQSMKKPADEHITKGAGACHPEGYAGWYRDHFCTPYYIRQELGIS